MATQEDENVATQEGENVATQEENNVATQEEALPPLPAPVCSVISL